MSNTPLPEPVGFRVRVRSEPGMIGRYPWTYCDARRRERTPRQDCEYDDLHTADQMRAHAAAVSAAKDVEIAVQQDSNAAKAERIDRLGETVVRLQERVRVLEDALRDIMKQHGNWNNGIWVASRARAALGDKNG